MNLGWEAEPSTIQIAKEVEPNVKLAMVNLLKEYNDVFSWSYEDMKGLNPKLYQHRIHLSRDMKPVAESHYRMNQNYAVKIEEIDKLLRVGFIRLVKQATWLSPIMVVPKKNGKIHITIDYRKLNATTVTNAFALPFMDEVLDTMAEH